MNDGEFFLDHCQSQIEKTPLRGFHLYSNELDNRLQNAISNGEIEIYEILLESDEWEEMKLHLKTLVDEAPMAYEFVFYN